MKEVVGVDVSIRWTKMLLIWSSETYRAQSKSQSIDSFLVRSAADELRPVPSKAESLLTGLRSKKADDGKE